MKHLTRSVFSMAFCGLLTVSLVPATALANEGGADEAPARSAQEAGAQGVAVDAREAVSATAATIGSAPIAATAFEASASVAATAADGITTQAINPLEQKISREDALAALRQFDATYPSFATIYDVTPSTVAPYRAGALNRATIEPALGYVNLVRYLAGLGHEVTTTKEKNEAAQAAAVVCAANGTIDHQPTRPAGMDDTLYQLGYEGAGSSNLSAGRPQLASTVLQGWLADPGENNKADLGHRRWILYPNLTTTGFGFAESNLSYRYYSAMETTGNYASDTGKYVAWPAQTTPVPLVVTSDYEKGYPWSFSVGGTIANPEQVRVTLTRLYDGKTWQFSQPGGTEGNDGELYVSNQGYGDRGCVIFTPDNLEETIYPYKDGDTFRVRIVGAVEDPIEYTVEFVNSYRALSDAVLTEDGATYKFTGKPVKPQVTLKYNGEALVEGVDFEFELQNNVNPGTVHGKIVGKGLYQGTERDISFEIVGDNYGFSDVERGAWYAIDDVLGFVTDRKIMNGYANGAFGPHDRITRGQAATVLHNLAGKPTATSKKFKDVNYGEYYGPAIAWARAEGIISGYADTNTFGPNNYVTREEFAAMLTTYARVVGKVDVTPVGEKAQAMSDYSSISSWAVPSVEWIMDKEIITGYALADGGTAIRPSGYTERCQAAKMLAVLQRDILGR